MLFSNWFVRMIKPTITNAALGALATAIIRFGWGGWVLGSTAEQMAKRQTAEAVAAALVPLCISESASHPLLLKDLAAISYPYARREFVVKAGWATMPGTDRPNRDLAAACAMALAETGQT